MTKLYQDQWHFKLRQETTEVQTLDDQAENLLTTVLLISTNVWRFGTRVALVVAWLVMSDEMTEDSNYTFS